MKEETKNNGLPASGGKRRMKNSSKLSAGEIVQHARLANIAKAGQLLSRLKPLLKQINEKEMIGDEPLAVIESAEKLEAAFSEFRDEYMQLFEDYRNSQKKPAKDKWY